nr:uncharacterized protein LOC111515744 [Leptinotarsa decemlineata]
MESGRYVCPPTKITDHDGGPSSSRLPKAAILMSGSSSLTAVRTSTIGRTKQQFINTACERVQGGVEKENIPDKILWKFDCDIGVSNNPDVVSGTFPGELVNEMASS